MHAGWGPTHKIELIFIPYSDRQVWAELTSDETNYDGRPFNTSAKKIIDRFYGIEKIINK